MRKLFIYFTLAILTMTFSAHAGILQCNDHKEFVKHSSNEIVSILEDKSLSDEQIEKKLTSLLPELLDIKWMGKFVLGRNWKKLSTKQQSDYIKAYENYLTSSYVPKFKEYKGQTIEITNSTPLKKKDEHLVYTIMSTDGEPDLEIAYRVSKTGVCFQVHDMIAEGVSLINTQRQDFGAVYRKKGYDGLVETLIKKSK